MNEALSCPPKSTSLVVCSSSARPAPEVAVNSGRGRSLELARRRYVLHAASSPFLI